MAKFSRTSTAYADDGSVVAANVPRMSSKGLLIEEGTTNLAPVLTNYSKDTGITYDGVVVGYENFSGYKFTYLAGTTNKNIYFPTSKSISVGDSITGTCWVKSNKDISNLTFNSGNNIIYNISLASNVWKRLSYTRVATTATTLVYSAIGFRSATTEDYELVISGFSVEVKPYATSFHPTTRTAESLTIPASCLSATEGTIEFDAILPNSGKNNLDYRYLLYAERSSGGDYWLTLRHVINSSQFQFATKNNKGESTSAYFSDSLITTDTKVRCAVKWNSQLAKVIVNGVTVATINIPKLPTTPSYLLFIGSTN